MGKTKHLSDVEKMQLSKMGEECGWAEILRAIGQHIAHEALDLEVGNSIRGALCIIAREVQQAKSRFE